MQKLRQYLPLNTSLNIYLTNNGSIGRAYPTLKPDTCGGVKGAISLDARLLENDPPPEVRLNETTILHWQHAVGHEIAHLIQTNQHAFNVTEFFQHPSLNEAGAEAAGYELNRSKFEAYVTRYVQGDRIPDLEAKAFLDYYSERAKTLFKGSHKYIEEYSFFGHQYSMFDFYNFVAHKYGLTTYELLYKSANNKNKWMCPSTSDKRHIKFGADIEAALDRNGGNNGANVYHEMALYFATFYPESEVKSPAHDLLLPAFSAGVEQQGLNQPSPDLFGYQSSFFLFNYNFDSSSTVVRTQFSSEDYVVASVDQNGQPFIVSSGDVISTFETPNGTEKQLPIVIIKVKENDPDPAPFEIIE